MSLWRSGQMRRRSWKRWEAKKVKHKNQMPTYYGKNIAQHAQRRFFQRKALEADQEKRRERDDLRAERALYEAEKRTDEYEHGERDHL